MTKPTSPDDNKQVANRAMVQAAVLAAVVLLCIVAWLAFDFLLLLFASILFGVLIHGVSCWLSRHSPLPYKASMAAFFVVLLLGLGGGAGWWRRASPSRPTRCPIRCRRRSSGCVSVPSNCPGPTSCCSRAIGWRIRCRRAPAPSAW